MTRTFTMEYWPDGDWLVGRLKEVPGVFSQGETLSELEDNLRDAYRMMMEDAAPLPTGIQTRELRITIARDESLISDLLENNPAFRAQIAKSKASPRKTFVSDLDR